MNISGHKIFIPFPVQSRRHFSSNPIAECFHIGKLVHPVLQFEMIQQEPLSTKKILILSRGKSAFTI